MDEYFGDFGQSTQPSVIQSQPSNQQDELRFTFASNQNVGSNPQIPDASGDNDFDDFAQDEVTKRIREEEERIQVTLKAKSDQEWEDKKQRRQAGRKALEEYQASMQRQKEQRAKENVRMEEAKRQEWSKVNKDAGWKKVVKNINIRQGQHKGKDTGRMRAALMHKLEDGEN